MNGFFFIRPRLRCPLFVIAPMIYAWTLLLPYSYSTALAQVTTAIRADSTLPTPTSVTQSGNLFNINGGTIRGANQFHSFDRFSIGTGDIASFNGPGNIANILSRVTGADSGLAPSMIYGTIQTTIPGANLFFMNPAGIVFGSTGSINVAGSVSFTTANYIRLFDGINSANFYANPASDGLPSSVLSTAPLVDFGFLTPAAFGFLDANPAPITVLGSALSVPVGQSITLVGGNISIVSDPGTGTAAMLTAPAGEIRLASVASPGEILLPNLQIGNNINGQSFSTMGTITLAEGTFLDVSDNAFDAGGVGGTIRIRGGQLVMDSAILFSATQGDTDGATTAIDINVTDDVSLNNFSAIASQSSGQGRGGNIIINAHNVEVAGASTIVTFANGDGRAGDISITASGPLSVHGTDGQGSFSNIESITDGSARVVHAGDSGNISVTAGSVTVNEQGYIQTSTQTDGNTGNIEVQAANVVLASGGIIGTRSAGQGSTGSLIVAATDTVSLAGDPQFSQLQQTSLRTFQLGSGDGGGISVTARNFHLTDGAQIFNQSNTGAGAVSIATTDSISISGHAEINNQAFSGSIGPIELSALKNITLSDQAVIRGSTTGGRSAGAISLTAESISLSGQSFITSRTISSGQGGQIQLTASDSVSLSSGSIITTSSLNPATGAAGPVAITAAQQISLTDPGTKVLSETGGSGGGGTVTMLAPQIQITNEAAVSARTTGSGNAGNVLVNADVFSINNGATITTASTGSGSAGNITIQGLTSQTQSVLINGAASGLFTTTSATGAGGDILLNANSVTLQNGGVLSAKTSGSNTSAVGGTVTVNAEQMVLSNQALVTAETNGIAPAGVVEINTGSLAINGGSQIRSSSGAAVPPVTLALAPPLTGGTVTVQGRTGAGSLADSVVINGTGSGIFTGTEGVRPGGALNVSAQSVSISNGALVTAATTGTGTGGAVTINAGNAFASSAGTVSSTASHAQGGDITITAGNSVTLANSSLVSASSTGPGNAGNILINAGQNYTSTDSAVTTQATAPGTNASGGNITVLASDQVRLTNSQLNASVQGSSTTVGGNISIDPIYVILQNSQIIAQALQGQGGNISITTNFFLPDSVSIVDASSQLGLNGTVNIQSPLSQLGGKLSPLPKNSLESTTWINSRCRALAGGQASSFVVAGRDMLPAEPGGWLGSPVTGLTGEPVFSAQVPAFPQLHKAPSREDTVSLRRMAPPGFLLQAFATDQSADCTS